MNKKLFVIFSMFLFSIGSMAQKLTVIVNYVTNDEGKGSGNNNIFYQPGHLLTWPDFKAKPVEGSDAVALTNAGFGIKLMFRSVENTSQLVISVSCSFSKKDSWVFPASKTPYILNHEQKHFDLAYIYTRSFIEKLRKANFTNANYASVTDKIYNETAVALDKIQDQYDSETSHSRIPAKQAEWDEKISGELASAVKE